MTGYVIDKDNKYCDKCGISNCGKCETATKDTLCTTCALGYEIKDDKKACFKCDANVFTNKAKGTCDSCTVSHCAKCSATGAGTCDACKSGYVLNGNKCEQCTITNCASCAFNTRTTECTACEGKYARQKIPNAGTNAVKHKCDALCDAHATACGDAYSATACDTKKNYYLAGGRCVYCNLKMKDATVAKAGTATTAGNQYLTADGICSTCDKDADGCAGSTSASKCKTETNEVNAAGNCVAKCGAYTTSGGYTGKCHNGCVSNVGTGTVNGGARNGEKGGCYGVDGIEAQLCTKGHHVQGASVGLCCDDDNSASSLVVGSVSLASVITALYALM